MSSATLILTRADRLIADSERAAAEFIQARPDYDATRDKLAFQVGHLQGTVRTLCAEQEAYAPDVTRGLERYDTQLDGRVPVTCGLDWTDGNEQGPGYWTLVEVWIAGHEVMGYMDETWLEKLRDEVHTRAVSARQLRRAA